MTWNNLPNGQEMTVHGFTPARARGIGIVLIVLAGLLILFKLVLAVDRIVPLPIVGRHVCPPRVVTYCVTAWNRDWWNLRSRFAIGQAARELNGRSRFRFKEIWCNSPHYLPIFFTTREVHDNWHTSDPFRDNVLAHTSFPGQSSQFIHVNDSFEWMQASDTLGRGFDLEVTILHEFLHVLGIEHDENSWGTLMRPYRYQHTPGQIDENRLHEIENRCIDADEHDPIEVLSPGPGETWRQGASGRASWRSEIPGPLHVAIFREDHFTWTLTDSAESSGSIDISTNTNWPLGAGYQVCVGTADWSTIGCSDMFLVAPP